LPDESDPSLTKELPGQMAPIDGANRPNTTPVGQPPAWGRTDRNRLLIWIGIAFLLPAPFLLALHFGFGQGGSLSTVQRESPAKAITVFFVSLATWIVSRMEKRFAVGFHTAWDWAETFFYGTPDSGLLGAGRLLNTSFHGPNWLTGGSAGPEGSIITIFILLLCALLIHFRFPKAVYPDRPV